MLGIFVFCIPFQKRIEFIHPETFRFGTFIDDTTVVLYLVDAIFLAAFLFLIVGKLLKRKNPLQMFHSFYALSLLIFILALAPSLLVHFSFVSFSFYVQLVVAALFSYFIYYSCQTQKRFTFFLVALFLSGIFQSLIAIAQFVLQKSLGLWILGESPYTISSLNVAKIVVNDDVYLRAYGTFPHPNALATFLGVTLLASLLLLHLKRHILLKNILRTLTWCIFFLLQFAALIFTFSRTGWLVAGISLVLFGFYIFFLNERSSDDISLKIKFRSVLVIMAVAACFLLWIARPFLLSRSTTADSHGDNAASERTLLINVSRETIPHHVLVGTGLRSFTSQIESYAKQKNITLEPWQHQPVHNIYLLLLTEAGVLGVIGFTWLIISFLTNLFSHFKKNATDARAIGLFTLLGVVSFLIVGLFDHHPWDIHQSLLVWLFLIGLGTGTARQN